MTDHATVEDDCSCARGYTIRRRRRHGEVSDRYRLPQSHAVKTVIQTISFTYSVIGTSIELYTYNPADRIVPIYAKCTPKYFYGSLFLPYLYFLSNATVLSRTRGLRLKAGNLKARAGGGVARSAGMEFCLTLLLIKWKPCLTGLLHVTSRANLSDPVFSASVASSSQSYVQVDGYTLPSKRGESRGIEFKLRLNPGTVLYLRHWP